MKKIFLLFPIIAAAFILTFTSCSTVEESGRRQIMLLSETEEQELGTQSYREVLAESTISKDSKMNARLDAVARRIVAAVGSSAPEGTQWEWHVLKEDTVNAFALPGGKIAVYSGLMEIATDEELAYVVGHEIGHVVARHGAERMSQQAVLSVVESLFVNTSSSSLFKVAYGLGAQYGVLLPYSRKQEYEADSLGSLYAARAGYNPNGSISMLQKLASLSGSNSVPEWLSTHPCDENRISAIQEIMPSRMNEYNNSPYRN